jgi:hypothetical protein
MFFAEEKLLSGRENELGVAINALQNLSANSMGFSRRHLKSKSVAFGLSFMVPGWALASM